MTNYSNEKQKNSGKGVGLVIPKLLPYTQSIIPPEILDTLSENSSVRIDLSKDESTLKKEG